MSAIQLEFNLDDADEYDIRLSCMQRQIDAIGESMGKVRRKLFAELGEVKKVCFMLQQENESLKGMLKSEKVEWKYSVNDKLFEVC